jgi:glycosyltransferase involved in cell wall biosynthesis
MYEALGSVFHEVHRCDRLGYPRGLRIAVENRLLSLVGRSTYYSPPSARFHARQIKTHLKGISDNWEVAFCIDSLVPIAALELDKPLVYFSDGTKTQLIERGDPGYDNLSPAHAASVIALERAAYEHCDLLIFASEWAANSAVGQYAVPREKVRVVPYGANLDMVPERSTVLAGKRQKEDTCEFLFLAARWERKGGDTAIAIVETLNQMGFKSRLTVCGTVPPCTSEHMRVVPFLDKHKEGDRAQLAKLLEDSTYLLVPTKADCSPIVFCEAFAYGLPVITCNVGGVPEIVTHGVNGFVLDPNAPAEEFANLIVSNYRNREAYLQFRIAARDAYEATFNWQHWARIMYTIAEGLVAS